MRWTKSGNRVVLLDISCRSRILDISHFSKFSEANNAQTKQMKNWMASIYFVVLKYLFFQLWDYLTLSSKDITYRNEDRKYILPIGQARKHIAIGQDVIQISRIRKSWMRELSILKCGSYFLYIPHQNNWVFWMTWIYYK